MISETEAFVILNSIPFLGASKIRMLVQRFGSAKEALNTPASQLGFIPGFDPIVPHWSKWQTNTEWKQDLTLVEKHQVHLIPFTSPEYPKSLLEIPDHPILLYVRGTLKPADRRSLAVVGTRHSGIYGNEMAENISKELAANGFTIVSGLARGIDTAAHRGALQQGRTLAVIGSGLADIYPSQNQSLADEISQKGALISEFPMRTPPDKQNFPQRNRIVAGMTLGTILIEAPIKSGAMITMNKAHQYRRKLFAIPGRADSDNFRGNHLLIKNGMAHLVENAEDILVHFDELFPRKQLKALDGHHPLLDNEEMGLWDKIPTEETTIEELSMLAGLPIQQLNRILMSLVLKRAIKEFPGKIYKKAIQANKS